MLLFVFALTTLGCAAVRGEDSVFFASDLMPLINKLGCNAVQCHGAQQGKGGFGLSMFGANAADDYLALVKSSAGRRVNRVEPLKSLVLLKATASIPHKGGKKITAGSPEYTRLASWIAQGTPWRNEETPDLVSIKVSPSEQTVEKGKTQQLAVAAVFADGTEKNVTRDAIYSSADDKVAVVDGKGSVKATGHGGACILVGYMRRFDTAYFLVPQPLTNPFPRVLPNNKIDELVLARLKRLGIPPSELCSDQHFFRRVYLDVVGTLPKPEETQAFLADADPQKRGKLIDRLLASEEFAEYWALKWGDLFRMKSEYPSTLWPNAVQAFHRWIRLSIAQDKPYDRFARELITSSGSNFRVPPANFYRAFQKKTPQTLAEVTTLIFMGARVGCARCHGHPSENWTLGDNLGVAAFFSPVKYKNTREWKEEIVYVDTRSTLREPRTGELVPPKFLGGAVVELKPGEDPRLKLAEWLTAPENPWFARNIVNRTWFWLLGRGIIQDPDDLRPTNPPTNPELLAYLEQELLSHKYDLKHIYRLILNSKTYQLSSKANQFNENDVAYFSHYYTKRLGAETLLDAIGQVTKSWDTYRSIIPEPYVVMPTGFRATHLADGSVTLPFLELFGRPPRDTAFESDRDLRLYLRQTLHMLNSGDVQNKINASPWLKQLLADVKEDPQIVDEVYLATLSRLPTAEEKNKITAYMLGTGKTIPESVEVEVKTAEEALTKARGTLGTANTEYEAAEKAAKIASTTAAGAKAAVAKAVAAQTATQNTATAKRRQAGDAKKKVDALVQAKQNLDEPALAKANHEVTAAEGAYQAAEKAAQVAETAAKAAKAEVDQAPAAQTAAEKSAAEKRNLANEAKAKRDKLAGDEKAVNAKLTQANSKLNAAKAALVPPRAQAIQDLMWAMFNTKEFLFNH
ncbi:MAG: DUF1553 domain-containing protein [Planctomycetota bacterium]|nr:DUF1553 domain-containing protein [Planctomycetota bacterium]